MQEDYSQFVPDVTFEKIPIKNLVSNQAYQRNISHIHVSRTADNFNLRQINPVKVSRRDGINYVFNGQHTAETVARVSGSRDTPVWCMVYATGGDYGWNISITSSGCMILARSTTTSLPTLQRPNT